MEFSKIARTLVKGTVHWTFSWTEHHRGNAETRGLKSDELAKAELATAMDALAQHLPILVGFPDDDASTITVDRWTRTESRDGIFYQLAGSKRLDNLMTPLPLKVTLGMGEVSGGLRSAFLALEEQAADYVNGERAQMEMFTSKGDRDATLGAAGMN